MAPEHAADPTWPSTACPPWCARIHHRDDEAEDRRHQTDGFTIPVVLAQTPTYLSVTSAEWVIHGHRGADGDATWLSIGSADTSDLDITLSSESTHRLGIAILACLSDLRT